VLVTDAEERSALAACRGLAAAGYRVSTCASRPYAVAQWSRRSQRRYSLPAPAADAQAYIRALAELLRLDPHDVLLPGSEASMLAVSAHREELPVATGLPPHDDVLRAVDKLLLQREAAAVGLAPPDGRECSTPAEALAAAEALGPPVVVKPARSFSEDNGRLTKGMARVCAGDDDLFAAVSELGPPVTVQRYAADAAIVSVAGVRLAGGINGLTVARYARTWPPEIGSASLAGTVDPPPGLTAAVEALLGRIGWLGIFELELLDLEGRFAAIDLNPRVFGWLGLAVAAGANLPAIWCDHVVGRPAAPAAARPGHVYRWEDGELRHLLSAVRTGRLREAISVARPHRRVAHAYFALRDPAPLVARALALRGRREAPHREGRLQAGSQPVTVPEQADAR
jgi:predicted ATP-grasp superfamily ATP-dependent carboligase